MLVCKVLNIPLKQKLTGTYSDVPGTKLAAINGISDFE